jgi:hypothetical protein
MKAVLKKILFVIASVAFVAGVSVAGLATTTSVAGADTISGSWEWTNPDTLILCFYTGYHEQNQYGFAVGNTTSDLNTPSCNFDEVLLGWPVGHQSEGTGTGVATAVSNTFANPNESYHLIGDQGAGKYSSGVWLY